MAGIGFSINMLTLFGIMLAIGIVVDDAIVVVENTSRHWIVGMSPKDAAMTAMCEITGPVIATTLGAVGGVRPDSFYGRDHGAALSAVRVDDFRGGSDQYNQCPDTQPRLVQYSTAALTRELDAEVLLLSVVQ